MLTTKNYNEQVALIDYTVLPDNLKGGYDFVKKSTQNYSNWDVYYKSEKIKKVIDLYFEKVQAYIPKIAKAQNPEKSKVKKTTKAALQKDKVIKVVEKIKVNKPEKVAKQETTSVQFVERFDDDLRIIKRYCNLSGKTKTQDEILRFINTLQKAIVEKKLRKTSPHASVIEHIQDDLIATYKDMGVRTNYYIPENKLQELKAIIGGEKIYPAIAYIKKYISLVGKKGIKQKATQLIKQMESAVKRGKIKLDDKYSDKLTVLHGYLKAFIDNPTQKTLEINTHELNGLQGIVDGCNCTSLNGLDSSLPVVMNSMDFANLEFNTIGLRGKWRELIGDPSPNFSAMVSGKPKMGKSFLCIDFAGHLARNHGKVLYVAKEEGLDLTLQTKLNEKNVKHPNLFVASSLPTDLSPYNFVFLDSVNKLGLQPEDLTTLKRNNPNKAFINIFQTTKDGNFRGANTFQHDVDVVIEIPERGKAVQFGRFNQGGEMGVW